MATAYTNLLGFALPVTGELSGTWGNVVNDSITELVEDAIAASATASVTSGDWTLTDTGGGAHNQARCAILIPTGTPGTARSILAPNSSKAYVVINQSDAAVTIKGVTGPTTGVSIAAGAKGIVAWNGSDFVKVADSTAYGDVFGPASSTDNAFARFDGTTGKLIQNSTGASLGDTGAAVFSQVNITGQGDLRLEDSAGGEYVALQAPASLASSYTLTMPVDDGSANQLLTTDGNGVLSWTSPASVSYPAAGMAVSTGSAWGTSKTTPSGDVVGTSDTQILTNKTINASNNTVTNVSLTAAVTGTLPIANGGTGLTSVGANGTILTSNGSSASWVAPAGSSLLRQTVITSSSTWTKGSGTTKILVQIVGGGGGGGGAGSTPNIGGGGGGAGGYASKLIDVSATTTISATIGAGGSGGSGTSAGGGGGTTTFSTLSATGGIGGAAGTGVSQSVSGSPGGSGSGGDINIGGGGGGAGVGSSTVVTISGSGGASFFGGGGNGARAGGVVGNGLAYGSGGAGQVYLGSGSGNGADGIVIIWEYA